MRRGIVHIGMPRTGSTSLQVILTHLRPHLLEHGVLYPEIKPRSFPWDSPNHQPFGETLDGRRPAHEKAECLAALSQTLARTQADTVILSYEDFAHQHRRFGVPELLRSALAQHGFSMEVAVVVKAPSEHLNSLYSHRAQMIRETRSFGEFARQVWRSGRFDYDALTQPWIAAADGRISAIPLRDRRSDAPLIGRFIGALGLRERIGGLVGRDERGLVENRSPGPIAVEASRRLRRMRVHRQAKVHLREIGRFIDERAWARGWDATPFRGNDPAMLMRIDAHFGTANDRFAQRVWGDEWGAVARDAGAREPTELAGRPIPPETEEQIAWLVAQTMTHHGFHAPPAWWGRTLNLVEANAARLAPVLGYRGWRVR